MTIALIITDRDCSGLKKELLHLNSNLEIQVWPDIQNPEKIEFAVLWKQPHNYLCNFRNLKAVTSLGAGIDFIESDSSLKSYARIYRVVTDGLKQQMAQYVLSYLLADFRQHAIYESQQNRSKWNINELNENATVGFLGLGEIGEFVAKQIQNLGFNVMAWTRSQEHKEIECFHEKQGLVNLLSKSDYVIGLLPLNQKSKNLLNLEMFKCFKKDSVLIQVGRGQQIVEEDLITALDKNYFRKAILDVFAVEPLPENHPLWSHPKIRITPHNSARSDDKQTASKIMELYNEAKSSN